MKKPAKFNKYQRAALAGAALQAKEARASDSFDGDRRYCERCALDADARGMGVDPSLHTCGLRPMTAAERSVVEAAMLYVARHTDGRRCDTDLDRSKDNCGSTEQLINSCRALRAERGGK